MTTLEILRILIASKQILEKLRIFPQLQRDLGNAAATIAPDSDTMRAAIAAACGDTRFDIFS